MTRGAQRESPLQNIASRRRKTDNLNPETQHRLTASSAVLGWQPEGNLIAGIQRPNRRAKKKDGASNARGPPGRDSVPNLQPSGIPHLQSCGLLTGEQADL